MDEIKMLTTKFSIINLLATIFTIFFNFLVNFLPLNNVTTGEISDSLPNLFVPAGYVFAIWGIIYLLNIMFVIYGFSNYKNKEIILQKVGYWYLIINALNNLWLASWHYQQFAISVLVMIAFLLSLIRIYINLSDLSYETLFEKIAIKLNFSIYLGWISVATVANITAFLVSINWDGFGITDLYWTFIILITVTGITSSMIFLHQDYAYTFVIIWAFVGIAINQRATPLIANGSIALVTILLCLMLVNFYKLKK
jgi:translocator protein